MFNTKELLFIGLSGFQVFKNGAPYVNSGDKLLKIYKKLLLKVNNWLSKNKFSKYQNSYYRIDDLVNEYNENEIVSPELKIETIFNFRINLYIRNALIGEFLPKRFFVLLFYL